MLEAFGSVTTIFIMIAIGYVLTGKGILNDYTSKLFSRIVISISMPLMIINSLPQRFTLGELIESSTGVLIVFFSTILTYIISYIVAKIIKLNKEETGLFCMLFTFSNSLFIGLPINTSLFGEGSIPYVLIYYLASTTLFWTIGVYNIKKYSDNNEDISTIEKIKKLFNPPLIGFIIGIFIIVFKIKIPFFISDAFEYIGNLSTPLSMLFIGTVIYNINFKEIKIDMKTIIILVGKFIVAPLILIISLSFFELPDILINVFIIESTGPIISSAGLVAQRYDVNPEYSAFMVGFTTVLYMVVAPIYVFLIG